jgi:hypothetical protein
MLAAARNSQSLACVVENQPGAQVSFEKFPKTTVCDGVFAVLKPLLRVLVCFGCDHIRPLQGNHLWHWPK